MEKKNHGIAAIPHLRVRFFGAEGAEKADLELGVLPSVFCDNINDWSYIARVVTPSHLRLVNSLFSP